MPPSASSRPTNSAPLRARRSFIARAIRPPAPRAVLDLRRAPRLLLRRVRRRLLRLVDGDPDVAALARRLRPLLGLLLGLLVLGAAAAQAAGGVQVAGSGGGGTHGERSPFFRSASMPSGFR